MTIEAEIEEEVEFVELTLEEALEMLNIETNGIADFLLELELDYFVPEEPYEFVEDIEVVEEEEKRKRGRREPGGLSFDYLMALFFASSLGDDIWFEKYPLDKSFHRELARQVKCMEGELDEKECVEGN